MSKEIDVTQSNIENRIFMFRNTPVMIDKDIAEMYQVETKVLNQAVKRNIERFPEEFRFKLNDFEKLELVTNCDRFALLKHSANNPYAFTEQGIAMLSAVLRSDIAIKVSIQIINAFVQLRKVVNFNAYLLQRIDGVERKQIESEIKFEQVFKALESNKVIPPQGVYFEGQVFDAYELSSKIIRSAKEDIVLIDNYIDEKTITQLAKKTKGVKVLLLTKNIKNELVLDLKKANEQYGNFDVKQFSGSHDRFLIIDGKDIYHIGASLKDLGKKLFAFSQMDKNSVASIINEIKELL
jgi:hypothetical protein